MSEVETSRTATEFQSITDGPTADTVKNMEDDVFSTNESCNQQNVQGDKSATTTPSDQTSVPVAKKRGRPRTKCNSLGSVDTRSSRKLTSDPKFPCGVCNNNITYSVYSI